MQGAQAYYIKILQNLEILFYCFELLGTGRQSLALPRRAPSALLAVPLVRVCWKRGSYCPRAGRGTGGSSWVNPLQETPLECCSGAKQVLCTWDIQVQSNESKTGCAEPRWLRAASTIAGFLQREPRIFKLCSAGRGAAWGKAALGLSEMFHDTYVLLDFGKRNLDLT